MSNEPNEREWKCCNEREKIAANNIADSFSRVVPLENDARGVLADLAYLEIISYRAELPSDRAAADEIINWYVNGIDYTPGLMGKPQPSISELRDKIIAALAAARGNRVELEVAVREVLPMLKGDIARAKRAHNVDLAEIAERHYKRFAALVEEVE